MVLYVIKAICSFLLLPGLIILVLLAAWRSSSKHEKRTNKFILVAILITYSCSISVITDPLLRSLEQKYFPPKVVSGDVIILLGGGSTLNTPDIVGEGHLSGNSANRLLTAARIAKIYHLPILYSGGRVYASSGDEAAIVMRNLVDLGVEKSNIYIEQGSLNTIQSARMLKPILLENGFKKPILVTSAFHMERSMRIFKLQGIEVTPFPADYMVNTKPQLKWQDFLPSFGAMYHLAIALREYLGILSLYTPYVNI